MSVSCLAWRCESALSRHDWPESTAKRDRRFQLVTRTRNSAIAEGPRDASCQLKSCQLPRNSAETTCTTSPEQIEAMKLEGYSGPCVINMCTQTITRASRFHCLIGVINKPTTDVLCNVHITCIQRLAVVKFSKSTMYKLLTWPWPCPLREHSLTTWPTHVQNLKSLALAVVEILHGV